LQQYRGKGVNVVDLWKQSGLPVDVFADAIATASYPEQGPCYPASLYPAIKEIYVPTDEVDLKSPLLRKSSRDILHQELTEFLNKQSSPAAASPVLTETAAITEAAILQLLPQGQGQFALNLRELATYLGVTDYAQLCIDLAGIGRSSTKLFVAVKTNSADSNYQDVYVSPNLIPQAEGMMIVLKDGEPAMVEDSRARLENALRAKLGLPLKARIALKVPTVVQEKLRFSDFQVDMWYSVFGEGGVLQAKGATVEELARFFARIDTQMPAWHVVVSDGKFRITAVIKATAMIKQGIARQGEAARINSHLTDLRKMESVLHRAGRVSSPVPSGELGGIDFRTMNLMIQPLGNFSSLDFRLPQSPNFAAIDLDKEQEDLNKMLEAGIIPSGERLKEYLAACYYRNEIDVRTRNFLTCLIEVCRLEEEHVVEATPELKEAIVIADSGKFISN
jgi:hypothetical protein